MKISKRLILFSTLAVVISVIIGGIYWAVSYVNNAWQNVASWTTEQVLIVQPQAKDLKVAITGDITSGNFTFSADYCQLYSVVSTDSTAELKCSLLPYYYTGRAAEAPKDWTENSDVKLVVKKTDVAPTSYLGRIDKSFDSVRAFGSEPVAVSFYVEGKASKPEKNIANLLKHAELVYKGKKEQVKVTISAYSVTPLNATTAAERAAYAKEWAKKMNTEISAHLSEFSADKKSGQDYLNAFRDAYDFTRIQCTYLGKCEYAYDTNPAENFMYYLYTREIFDKKELDKTISTAKQSLYPFYSVRKDNSDIEDCPTCTPNWSELAAYTFPICPINDIINGKKSTGTALFETYTSEFLAKSIDMPKTSAAASKLLDVYKKGNFSKTDDFDSETVSSVNLACYYVLENNLEEQSPLKTKLINTYFAMLSEFVGTPLTQKKNDLEKYIYESTVLTPYKSSYLADPSVHKFRETNLETSTASALKYTEWRSILSSLVLLYIYAGTTQN